ncbi:zinc-binding dehydrogenase [Rhodovulum sp. DZ06]|uniref:zinc-binding dehydrogenase n=1 Tax=Rhodovulum sp. DZ06 TaxID=3425126 RepID=UPI003D344D67
MSAPKGRARPAALEDLGPGASVAAAEGALAEGALRLLPTPEAGQAALLLEAATLSADPDAPAGVTLGAAGASAKIIALGEETEGLGLRSGMRVALPDRAPCGGCASCAAGRPGFCAAPVGAGLPTPADLKTPPGRGLVAPAALCIPAEGASAQAAALLGPLAAALHALEAAGPTLGARALVCGRDLSAALCVHALRMAGAAHVAALAAGGKAQDRLRAAGADAVIDAGDPAAAAEALEAGEPFTLCIDVSGAAGALHVAAAALAPGGTLVLAAAGGSAAGPLGLLAERELRAVGAARPAPDLSRAAALLRAGRAEGAAALLETLDAADAAEAPARLKGAPGPLLLTWAAAAAPAAAAPAAAETPAASKRQARSGGLAGRALGRRRRAD